MIPLFALDLFLYRYVVNVMDNWLTLSARIKGLAKAALLYAEMKSFCPTDIQGGEQLFQQAQQVFGELETFALRNSERLSQPVNMSLVSFLENNRDLFQKSDGDLTAQLIRTKSAIIVLAAFESELSYLLSDSKELMRRRTELAFVHLQRCIVVDEEFRNKWKNAFDTNEPACERLGAVHLLHHGIWAFKVNAIGARTDLVFNEPLRDRDIDLARKSSEGLVLTEWKVAKEPSDIEDKIKEARRGADLYREGALAGIELTGYRYLVVVTKGQATTLPPDELKDDVVYRHINIAVDPLPPSLESRR